MFITNDNLEDFYESILLPILLVITTYIGTTPVSTDCLKILAKDSLITALMV